MTLGKGICFFLRSYHSRCLTRASFFSSLFFVAPNGGAKKSRIK
jgi:hypothetical protein